MPAIEPTTSPVERPTISIYQNSEHVAGLVQQLFDSPLVTAQSSEEISDDSRTRGFEAELTLNVDAKAKIPFLADAAVSGDAGGKGSRSKVVTTGSKTTQSFVYSQAYYLNTVRRGLRSLGLLHPLTTRGDGASLSSGDFVEFQATFTPSELITFTDVLTPDLVGAIAGYLTKRSALATFDGYESFEKVQAAALQMRERATANADIAREATKAVKADFRQDKTREYYGHIGAGPDAITAITICDNDFFVVSDEDRILDGSFTVLGKVTSAPEEDVPVLQRNKLLRNISADGVDALIDQLVGVAKNQKAAKIGDVSVENLLDLKLASRIPGTSIRVIPLAIYA